MVVLILVVGWFIPMVLNLVASFVFYWHYKTWLQVFWKAVLILGVSCFYMEYSSWRQDGLNGVLFLIIGWSVLLDGSTYLSYRLNGVPHHVDLSLSSKVYLLLNFKLKMILMIFPMVLCNNKKTWLLQGWILITISWSICQVAKPLTLSRLIWYILAWGQKI